MPKSSEKLMTMMPNLLSISCKPCRMGMKNEAIIASPQMKVNATKKFLCIPSLLLGTNQITDFIHGGCPLLRRRERTLEIFHMDIGRW